MHDNRTFENQSFENQNGQKHIQHNKPTIGDTVFPKMAKSTKDRRDAHFKKMTKRSDDDPDVYKKAPGDDTAKTKPSKHTQKFKQMYGEKNLKGFNQMYNTKEKNWELGEIMDVLVSKKKKYLPLEMEE